MITDYILINSALGFRDIEYNLYTRRASPSKKCSNNRQSSNLNNIFQHASVFCIFRKRQNKNEYKEKMF